MAPDIYGQGEEPTHRIVNALPLNHLGSCLTHKHWTRLTLLQLIWPERQRERSRELYKIEWTINQLLLIKYESRIN